MEASAKVYRKTRALCFGFKYVSSSQHIDPKWSPFPARPNICSENVSLKVMKMLFFSFFWTSVHRPAPPPPPPEDAWLLGTLTGALGEGIAAAVAVVAAAVVVSSSCVVVALVYIMRIIIIPTGYDLALH